MASNSITVDHVPQEEPGSPTSQDEADAELSSQPTPSTGEVTEHEGEIGYWKNENTFVSLTNYSIKCVGYVTRGAEDEPEGFLLLLTQKPKAKNKKNKSQSYYITWREMSCQAQIWNVISSKKFYTSSGVKYKQEFLPQYLKSMCDEYFKGNGTEAPKRVYPVEFYGLQPCSDPPLWVLGHTTHIKIEDNHATLVPQQSSSYHVLDTKNLQLPSTEIEALDDGKGLKMVISLLKEAYLDNNFISALLMVGGVALSTHFASLGEKLEFSPIVASGSPVTAKSMAVKAAFSIFGPAKAYEGTTAGLLKKLESRTIPIWWEDPDDMKTIEKIVVTVFNKVERTTFVGEKHSRALPVITLNPENVFGRHRSTSNKTLRLLSRLTFVPFTEIKSPLHIAGRLDYNKRMSEAMAECSRSLGILLTLQRDLEEMITNPNDDDVLKEVEGIVSSDSCKEALDLRSKMSYALLFYATAKILGKLGLLEPTFFAELKTWCLQSLLPQQEILRATAEMASSRAEAGDADHGPKVLIETLLKKAASNYENAKEFVIPYSKPVGCLCGEVVTFNITKAIENFPEAKGSENLIRRYIKSTGSGCNSKKANFSSGQLHCCHIKRSVLSKETLEELDEAWKTARKPRIKPSNKSSKDLQVVHDKDLTYGKITEKTKSAGTGNQKEWEDDEEDLCEITEKTEKTGSHDHGDLKNEGDLRKIPDDTESCEQIGSHDEDELQHNTEEEDDRKIMSRRSRKSVLMDALHPGIVTGKRTKRKKANN